MDSPYSGLIPSPKLVFPVSCLVETVIVDKRCGEAKWIPAKIIEVKPVMEKGEVPYDKLYPDGNIPPLILFFQSARHENL